MEIYKKDLEALRILIRRKNHTAPEVNQVVEILEILTSDPSPKQVQEKLKKYPSICLSVLKMASSPAYAGAHIVSLLAAIELLGTKRISTIVASIGMAKFASTELKGPILKPDTYLKRALALGFVSEMIAKKQGRPDSEMFYLSGLFQEVGYLFISQHFPEDLDKVLRTITKTQSVDVDAIETHYLGYTHAMVSGMAAEEFNFHPMMQASLYYHHDVLSAPDDMQQAADIAHVSSWFVGEMGIFPFEKCPQHELDPFACMRLGWQPEEFASLVSETITHMQAAASSLKAA